MTRFRKVRHVPTEKTPNPNISTENQPEGAARRPSDTLDREPERDPESGGSISADYNPESGTRLLAVESVNRPKDQRAARKLIVSQGLTPDQARDEDVDLRAITPARQESTGA